MPSSGMLRLVALISTDVPEVRIASMMEAIRSSEIVGSYKSRTV
jgi:hypothetical protein